MFNICIFNRKICQALRTLRPLLCVCCVWCILITIAIVVVLAFIPLYLQVNSAAVNPPNSGADNLCCLWMKTFSLLLEVSFLATYLTDQNGTNTLLATNIDNLNTQVDHCSFLFYRYLHLVHLHSLWIKLIWQESSFSMLYYLHHQ